MRVHGSRAAFVAALQGQTATGMSWKVVTDVLNYNFSVVVNKEKVTFSILKGILSQTDALSQERQSLKTDAGLR